MTRWLSIDRALSDHETQRIRAYGLESLFGTPSPRYPTEEEQAEANDGKREQSRKHKRRVRQGEDRWGG